MWLHSFTQYFRLLKKPDWLLLAGSVSACVVGTEIFLRTANIGYNNGPLDPSEILHHIRPKNYSFTSYSPLGEWDSIIINTNKYGDRVVDNCKNIMKSGQTIILGDSFVAGIQVQNSNTIAGKLQSLSCEQGIKVQNLGVSSYSPLLSYAQLCHRLQNKEMVLEFSEENKVIHILFDNDISDDSRYEKWLIRSTPCPIIKAMERPSPQGMQVQNSNTIAGKLHSLFRVAIRHSYFLRLVRRAQITLIELSKREREIGFDLSSDSKFTPSDECKQKDKDIIATSRYIKKMKNLLYAHGAEYFVSAVPYDSRKANLTNYSCFKSIADLAGVKFIHAPSKLFSNPEYYYFEKDIHLNAKGSVLFAEKLYGEIFSTKIKK